MRTVGNLIWVCVVGLELAVGWALAGCLWSITIIGIPVGMQCFKIAALTLFPFGKEIVYEGDHADFIVNIIWFLVSGLWLCIGSVLLGGICCMTIIGIPFGLQYFKYARLAISPFGARVVKKTTHL